MTPTAAFDNAFALLAWDVVATNARDGLTPADSARHDAASAAFDALLSHVYPGLSPRAADRMREQVVLDGVSASIAAQDLRDWDLLD